MGLMLQSFDFSIVHRLHLALLSTREHVISLEYLPEHLPKRKTVCDLLVIPRRPIGLVL